MRYTGIPVLRCLHEMRCGGKKANVLGVANREKQLSWMESVSASVYSRKQSLRQGHACRMMSSDPWEQEWGLGRLKQQSEGSQGKDVPLGSALQWATMTQSCWDPLSTETECTSELSTPVIEEVAFPHHPDPLGEGFLCSSSLLLPSLHMRQARHCRCPSPGVPGAPEQGETVGAAETIYCQVTTSQSTAMTEEKQANRA